MTYYKSDQFLVLLLRLGTFMCFAGWTWVHWYWEGPYGAMLWSDSAYELAESLGLTWEEFVGTGADDGFIQVWLQRLYWPYLLCTILSLTAGHRSWLQHAGLVTGSLLLLGLSYAKYVGSQYQIPMFVEHGGQILMPVVLVLALRNGPRRLATIGTACIALMMTFAGHGSYAMGLWPTPPTFFAMTTVLFGTEYETTSRLLFLAGILDLIVCVAIFFPPVRRTAAIYAAIWGLLTAVARPAAGMSSDLIYWGADQFVHEAVIRAPHFVLPLFLFVAWQKSVQSQEGSTESDRGIRSADNFAQTA